MAYTFDELFTRGPQYDPTTYNLTVKTTIMIAQEDGRCAYGSGSVDVNPTTQVVSKNVNAEATDSAFEYGLWFSDRGRFSGDYDEIGLEFTKGLASGCDMKVILWEYGGANYSVHLDLPTNLLFNGKLYTGRGDTIGHGAGQALHAVAFNEFVAREIPEPGLR